MPNASWPAGVVPAFAVNGYTETPAPTILATPADAGPGKRRRLYTADVRTIRGRMDLDAEDVDTLQRWITVTLAAGTLPFDWTDPRTGTTRTFRFNSLPQFTPIGFDHWIVTFDLQMMAG